MYTYSLLAEAAKTGEIPPWSCKAHWGNAIEPPQLGNGENWNNVARKALPVCSEGPPPCIQHLKMLELEKKWEGGWRTVANKFREEGQYVGAYEPDNGGPSYLVCESSGFDGMLFVGSSELRIWGDDGDLRNVWWLTVLFFKNTLNKEGLETVTLQINKNFSDSKLPDKVTAIRGTKLNSMRQIIANFKGWFGTSCVFRLMASIVYNMVLNDEGRKYAVTGHSLGGAAAQYVAKEVSKNEQKEEFLLFAFSSIGIDLSDGRNPDPEILHSFIIEGDLVVEKLGGLFGLIQGGRTVRYYPEPSGAKGWLEKLLLLRA